MNRLIRLIRGYVRIRLTSRRPERFLSLCAHNRLFLWNLLYREGACEMNLSAADFFRLAPLCRKSGSRVHILEKHGLPFFLHRYRKRKAFFLGIFLCFGLLFWLSLYIWNIHVEGNFANSTGSILEALASCGVVHGTAKRELDCADIAARLRQAFPNITWVSARVEGTRLILTVRENTDNYEAKAQSDAPRDLVAAKDGVVSSLITRAGVPQVLPGDEVKKGDVLVSGAIPIQNDSQEITGYLLVRADADILLETSRAYYDSFPRVREVRTYEKPGPALPVLQIFSCRICALPWKESGPADTLLGLSQVFLTENFALPLYLGSARRLPYRISRAAWEPEEARALSEERFRRYSENLSKIGVQICGNHVRMELTETTCTTKGTLTVREAAVTEQPCPEPEEPVRKDTTAE